MNETMSIAEQRVRARIAALEAENKRLRAALESIAVTLEHQAMRAVEQPGYHPSTARRYASLLKSFAYQTRDALRAALTPEEQPSAERVSAERRTGPEALRSKMRSRKDEELNPDY